MKDDQKAVEQLKQARIDYKRHSSIIEMMEGVLTARGLPN